MKPPTLSTQDRIEQYQGKVAVLATWEQAPLDLQLKEHDYILSLKVRVRSVRNYILHRNDVDATV